MKEFDYYGVNLLFYKANEVKAIRKRIYKLLDQVYFPGPAKKIIFDSSLSIDKLYQLNKEKAEELARLFDKSPAILILRKADRGIMRWNLKRENLIQGINIIQDMKGIRK